jgi:hypothetical protein
MSRNTSLIPYASNRLGVFWRHHYPNRDVVSLESVTEVSCGLAWFESDLPVGNWLGDSHQSSWGSSPLDRFKIPLDQLPDASQQLAMARKIGHRGVTSGPKRKPFIKTNEFQTGMELRSRVGGRAKIIIHSQSVGLEGMDQCGFQSNFLVSAAVRKIWTKL